MTITKKTVNDKNCDCCGKTNTKIQRRYKGEGYCSNCYSTWFKKKPCFKCGEIKRLHKKESNAVCHDCIMKEPCIRCGKSAVKDGANTPFGRVCKVCYQNYFKTKKRCYECGEYKSNLSRYEALEHKQEVCLSCYRKHSFETCSSCRRYRKLVETPTGKKCKKCHENGLIPCNTCKKLIPAGVGVRCWDCYWQARLDKQTQLNSYLFSSPIIKKEYEAFNTWFAMNKGAKKAQLKSNNFIDFFVRCEQIWGLIPNYEVLIAEFKPEGLRHNLTVLRWLIDTGRIVENLELKDYVSEQERIVNLLGLLDGGIPIAVKNYYAVLLEKHLTRQTSLKTVRMYLQPVVALHIRFQLNGQQRPFQEQIDSYLLDKSGQSNSLSSYISFLNKKYGSDLVCKKPDKSIIAAKIRKHNEKQLLDLAIKPKPLSPKDRLRWYKFGLAFFHEYQVSLKTLEKVDVTSANDEMDIISIGKHQYWVPKPE